MNIDPQILRKKVQEYLTTYLLQNVWNLPYTEYRQNIKLRLVSNKKAISNVLLYGKQIALPARESFYVYDCPITRHIGLYPLTTTWTTLTSFINKTGLDIRIHGEYGEWLYRNAIYINVVNKILIIAVSSSMHTKITNSANPHEMYMSLYKQPDSVDKLSIQCKVIATTGDITDAFVDCVSSDIVFINGRESKISSTNNFQIDDYVEMIKDPDILGTINISDSNPTLYKTFIDSSDSQEKIIIHIPKNYNFKNMLITHNTCDVFIRPKFKTDNKDPEYYSSRMSGVFLSRADTDQYIGQITHNDFYISKSLIDSYKSKYGFTDITLHVVVRRAGKNDKLIQEKNYIEILYLLDDDEILDFLSGNGDPLFPFWTADVLANSDYAKTMYQLQKPADTGDLSMYLNMFGYLNCLNLACAKIFTYSSGHFAGGTILLNIPIALLGAKSITCIPNVNGVKVPDGQFTIRKTTHELEVELDSNIEIDYGTNMSFELIEDIEPRASYFTPTSTKNKLQIDDSVLVYRVRNVGTGYTKNKITYDYSITKSYELITTGYSIVTINEVEYVQFNTNMYNTNFLIISKKCFKSVYKKTFTMNTLDRGIISTGLLTTSCKQWDSDDEITIPVLWENPLIYLNGYELAKPIDYTTMKLLDNSGRLLGYAYHINCVDYLNGNINELEVVVTPDNEILHLNTFSHNNTNESILSTLLWYDNINSLTADGSPVAVKQKTTEALFIASAIAGGSLLHTRISLPDPLVDLFNTASIGTNNTVDTDRARISLIQQFFKQRQDKDYKVSKIEKSHSLYSILLTMIIRDYLNGTLSINTSQPILPQLTAYTALSAYDVLINNNLLSITVSNSNLTNVNGVYSISVPYSLGKSRIWNNSNNTRRILYNSTTTRWELVITTSSEVLFYSTPVEKDYDPWFLFWYSADTNNTVPFFSSEAIDFRYIDAFPSYLAYDINLSDVHKYHVLKSVIDTLLPTDKIQDGVTLQ